jgi:hypothetical protein
MKKSSRAAVPRVAMCSSELPGAETGAKACATNSSYLAASFSARRAENLHDQIQVLSWRRHSLDPPNPFAHWRFSAFSRRAASLTSVRVFARFVHG